MVYECCLSWQAQKACVFRMLTKAGRLKLLRVLFVLTKLRGHESVSFALVLQVLSKAGELKMCMFFMSVA